MAVNNNLYPPIIDTYMPAFLITDNSSDINLTTKSYTTQSYVNLNAYESAYNQYIVNSSVDGVEELWEEYWAAIAIIDADTSLTEPEKIARKLETKTEYDAELLELISGTSTESVTENIFFEEKPEVETITKTVTFESVNTTNNKFICKVYFALSPYNSINEISNAQVTLRNQVTNRSVLHKIKYPSEIMLKKINIDENRETKDKYYIEIRPEDLNGNNFIIDQYYKIQIRFTSSSAEDPEIDLDDPGAIQSIDDWLTRNLYYFSEWSTVCLIRGISVPTLSIKDFNNIMATEIYDSVNNTSIIGSLFFADENETETLKFYRIKTYDDNNNLLIDSGDIYLNNFTDINHFNYSIPYSFQLNNSYHFIITYTTQNSYSENHRYDFTIIPAPGTGLNATIETIEDIENGRIGIHIVRSSDEGSYTGHVAIRRANNKNNFTIWEDIYIATYNNVPSIDLTWYDYTVESGIFYLYGVQGIDTDGGRTEMTIIQKHIMLDFNDIFLLSEDKQLKIKFNPNLTSFKRNISEIKVDTIGNQYPFIKRNGAIDYVQFPLGGLITSAMDEAGLFTTKLEVFGDSFNDYESYNEENDVKIYQDVVWEKFFRNKVENFLYKDNVKLFRSPTEGNYLIKLMDINFQPNQTLGRRLWSFSAVAYEIDNCNFDNYEKYNIVSKTNGGVIVSGGGDEPSTLLPIQRVVIINNEQEFPAEGRVGILYLFNKQFYLWDEENSVYFEISVPWWNMEATDFSQLIGAEGRLYTNTRDLYLWNNTTNQYDVISVPVMEG